MNKTFDFIQIGSHVGKTRNDPIYKAIEKGLCGILIEPVPYLFDQLVENYKEFEDNLLFINKAVSARPGVITLYVPSKQNDFSKFPKWANQLASSNPDHIQDHLPELISEKITVPCITINQLIQNYGITTLRKLIVDTEGHDFTILKSLDLSLLRPNRIHFENKHMDGVNQRGERYKSLLNYFGRLGYEVERENTEDTVIISAEALASHNQVINRIIQSKRAMVNRKRLINLNFWCKKYKNSNTAFVECGVAQGGSLSLMAHWAETNPVYGFDSFEGMPALTTEDEGSGEKWVNYNCSKYGEAAVADTFSMVGVDLGRVNLVKGFFEDTLMDSAKEIGPISILRLDNDWYQSTKFCLEALYDQVVSGGVIIIDDYGTFKGCKKAVDEFRRIRKITDNLITVDRDGEHYWVKGNEPISSSNEEILKSPDKTLIFVSVFMNTDYVRLLSLLLVSLFLNKGKEQFKLVVITDRMVMKEIEETTPIDLFDHDFFLMDCESVFESAYNRLKIFEYPDIDQFGNLLYLDLDILISSNLDQILRKKNQLVPEKLSAMREGSIMKKFWGGSFFFTLEELKEFECLDGFCSGVLFFKNQPQIKSLFEHVLEDIANWKSETEYVPSLLEQPFLNHRTARREQRELDLLEGLITMNPESQNDQVISHFAGGPGKSYSKIKKMSAFMLNQLLPTHRRKTGESCDGFNSALVGNSYKWLHDMKEMNGRISFTPNEVLKTSWSTGRYEVLREGLVYARWSGIPTFLMFNANLSELYSIRLDNLSLSRGVLENRKAS